jgi:c-di-GMP-binding flagellar brake protein YcgR
VRTLEKEGVVTTDADPEERRRHPRLQARVPIYIHLGSEVFQKMVPLETENVSVGGLAFETSRELPVEAESLVVVARLGDMPASARIEGRVAYCRRNEASGRYTVGIRFTAFEGVTSEQLAAYLEAWQEETPPA